MTARRRPTMKDVAEHANVSVSTVSYVVNDSGPVAPERRNRVLDAVRLLEYQPNQSARSLKRRSVSTIGLIVPELTNQFFAMVAQGVQEAASAFDVLVVLVVPDAANQSEDKQAMLLRSQRLDGLIYLSGTGSMPSSMLELSRSGPVVLVDERVPGSGLEAVVSDSRRGAREVATHVLEQGHRQVAVIGGPSALWTAQQRLAGYREAFAAAGMDPDEVPILVGDYRQESGVRLAAEALAVPVPQRPTAFVCANDLMAIGALEHCKSAGISVPGQLSIVGFDDLPISAFLTPRLTTVRQPAREMGYRAATRLLGLLGLAQDGKATSGTMPADVQLRDSVAAPPQEGL